MKFFFGVFHSEEPNPKNSHRRTSSLAKPWSTHSQTCMKERDIDFLINRNKDANTKRLFSKRYIQILQYLMGFATLCMTGELWTSSFFWHQDIRVTQLQSSAMTFIFTQYFFCNSLRRRPPRWKGNNWFCNALLQASTLNLKLCLILSF